MKEKNLEEYETPSVDVRKLENNDVIITSYTYGGDEGWSMD